MTGCFTGGQKGRALVRQALREASHMGLNVMRVFAHTTDPNFPLQTAPGVYNEKVFKALDFVLVEVGYTLGSIRLGLGFLRFLMPCNPGVLACMRSMLSLDPL